MTTLPTDLNIRELARRLRRSRQTLYNWRDAGCPMDRGEQGVRDWLIATGRQGAVSDQHRVLTFDECLDWLHDEGRRLHRALDGMHYWLTRADNAEAAEMRTRCRRALAALAAGLDHRLSDLQEGDDAPA